MSIASAISKLREAQGDPQKLTLATLDIVLSAHERWLRKVLQAAAIPHWVNADILSKLLQVDAETAAKYMDALKALPMVETFAARGGWNVHEATRLAIRSDMAENHPELFQELSALAARVFKGDEPHLRVESIYHLLVAVPTRDTSEELRCLWTEWQYAGRHEPQQMLAGALKELLATIRLRPLCRARSLLCCGYAELNRIPASRVEEMARESAAIFQSILDPSSEADSRSLIGDVLSAQGRREEALREYQECKRIFLDLSRQDADSLELLRELATSRNKVGSFLEIEGRHEEALQEHLESKRINLELTRREPANLGWLRDLAVSNNWVGDGLAVAGQREEALLEYQESKRIRLELVRHDPGNAIWQRDLSVSHNRVGDVLEAEGRREEALLEYRESKRIMLNLTQLDPGNAGWLSDLSAFSRRLGEILEAETRWEEALQEYEECKRIGLELTRRDPSNTDWLRDLGLAHNRIGSLLAALPENLLQALEEHQKSEEIAERLVKLDPANQQWAIDLEAYQGWVSDLRLKLEASTGNFN